MTKKKYIYIYKIKEEEETHLLFVDVSFIPGERVGDVWISFKHLLKHRSFQSHLRTHTNKQTHTGESLKQVFIHLKIVHIKKGGKN